MIESEHDILGQQAEITITQGAEAPDQTTSHDRHEQRIAALAPVTVADLYGGSVPVRKDLSDAYGMDNKYQRTPWTLNGQEMYDKIGNAPLHPFKVVDSATGKTQYVVVGPPLTGMEINGILYFTAPSKVFGFDTRDILMDWHDLYHDAQNKKRLEAHRRMPRWGLFEPTMETIYKAIKGDYERQLLQGMAADPDDVIVPAISFMVGDDGKASWNFDVNQALIQQLVQQAYPERMIDQDRILTILGPALVGSFSPHVTNGMDIQLGYTDRGSETNNMGATQALPLTLRKASEFEKSDMFPRLIGYMDTGKIQPVANTKPNSTTHQLLPPTNELYKLPTYKSIMEMYYLIPPPESSLGDNQKEYSIQTGTIYPNTDLKELIIYHDIHEDLLPAPEYSSIMPPKKVAPLQSIYDFFTIKKGKDEKSTKSAK